MKYKKPPIGLIPRKLHEEMIRENRKTSIRGAISRYHKAGKPIPKEWIREYNDLVKEEK